MKRINLVALVALLLSASTQSQAETADEGVYRIKAPRFARALVEKWITDYNKVDSRMRLQIASAPDERLSRFLNWVVTIGREHNHEFGLLNLDDKSLAAEAGKLNRVLTAQK